MAADDLPPPYLRDRAPELPKTQVERDVIESERLDIGLKPSVEFTGNDQAGKDEPVATRISSQLTDEDTFMWRLYRDEMMYHDHRTLSEFKETLNSQFIFALILASVVATLLAIMRPLSTVPQNAYAVTAVYALLLAKNDAVKARTAQSVNLVVTVQPLERVAYGLELASLITSCGVALLALLLKQWLAAYHYRVLVAATDTTPTQWVLRRQVLQSSLIAARTSWLMTRLLPAMLHLSIFLLIAGVTRLAWSLDTSIASWVTVITGLLITFYVTSAVFPVLRRDFPTSTALSKVVRIVDLTMRIVYPRVAARASNLAARSPTPRLIRNEQNRGRDQVAQRFESRHRWNVLSLTTRKDWDHVAQRDILEDDAISVLLSASHSASEAARQVLSALPPSHRHAILQKGAPVVVPKVASTVRLQQVALSATDISHAVLTGLYNKRQSWDDPKFGADVPESVRILIRRSSRPEAKVLTAVVAKTTIPDDDVLEWVRANPRSESLASTALCLLEWDGYASSGWLLQLLLLVSSGGLSADMYPVISSKCIAALGVVAPHHSDHSCDATCIASFVAVMGLSSPEGGLHAPQSRRVVAALATAGLISHIICGDAWMERAIETHDIDILLQFMADVAWRQSWGLMMPYLHAVETYMLDTSFLLVNGGPAYSDALSNVLQVFLDGQGPRRNAYAGRLGRVVTNLLAREAETTYDWLFGPQKWKNIVDSVMHVFCLFSSTMPWTASELQFAAALAAALSMLKRAGSDVSDLSLMFVSHVEAWLSSTTEATLLDSAEGAHLAFHYRELVKGLRTGITPLSASPQARGKFEQLCLMSAPCMECPVWPRRAGPWVELGREGS